MPLFPVAHPLLYSQEAWNVKSKCTCDEHLKQIVCLCDMWDTKLELKVHFYNVQASVIQAYTWEDLEMWAPCHLEIIGLLQQVEIVRNTQYA